MVVERVVEDDESLREEAEELWAEIQSLKQALLDKMGEGTFSTDQATRFATYLQSLNESRELEELVLEKEQLEELLLELD